MDLKRMAANLWRRWVALTRGQQISLVAGALLLVGLSKPWWSMYSPGFQDLPGYMEPAETPDMPARSYAWDAQGLAGPLTIVGAAAVALGAFAFFGKPLRRGFLRLPVTPSAIVTVLGAVAFALVAYRAGVSPAEASTPDDRISREPWLWVSLGASAGVALGGWRALREDGTSLAEEWGRLRAWWDERHGRGQAPPRAGGASPTPSG